MANIETILRDHVTLRVESIDRLYLHGYVPGLQRPGQLAYFFTKHRGHWLPSPALIGRMTERFVAAIKGFAQREAIPIVQFKRGERKDTVAKRHLARFRRREGRRSSHPGGEARGVTNLPCSDGVSRCKRS